MKSLEVVRIPLEQTQQDQLRTLFASPGWLILREVLSAHCVEAQAEFLDASMYENDVATGRASAAQTKAKLFNDTLDVLDGLQGKMDEWYRINLEQRR